MWLCRRMMRTLRTERKCQDDALKELKHRGMNICIRNYGQLMRQNATNRHDVQHNMAWTVTRSMEAVMNI